MNVPVSATDGFALDRLIVDTIDVVPHILDVICDVTGMRYAAVARVTSERWMACAVLDRLEFGLGPGDELKIEETLCRDVLRDDELVVFDDCVAHPVYEGHNVPVLHGFRSYISAPIRTARRGVFGTLCALDPDPHPVSAPATVKMIELFAELIASHLDTHDRLEETERQLRLTQENLKAAREAARLRDQFVAVLSHDLRSPLAGVDAGLQVLRNVEMEPRAKKLAEMLSQSTLRMIRLVNNMLDFTRNRLGDGGIPVHPAPVKDLARQIRGLVEELRLAYPERRIDLTLDFAEGVVCDPPRLAQMLGNLVCNALQHGDEEATVSVAARREDGRFVLEVANRGAPLPPDFSLRMRQPHAREDDGGLGLGLFIASQIAEGHGGTLTGRSEGGMTRLAASFPDGG